MNRRVYTYSIDDCDVVNKESCEAFRKSRLNWIEWLNGNDPHSVSNQVYSMIWNYALFCVVNELRRMATDEPQKNVGFNGYVIHLFDAGFVTTQAIAIRRLIEKPKNNPEWAVISLRSILKDIDKNTNLITRENYVCYDGLPYDYEAVHKQWLANTSKNAPDVHVETMSTTGPAAWHSSELLHKNFDILSGVSSRNRKRTDTIKSEVFTFLENQIDTCKDIKRYVDKFIAHASAPETRIGITENQPAITLDRLKVYHRTLYQVANFINAQLLYESNFGGVPAPQDNHLVNLDKSWATTSNLSKAHQIWDEYVKEVSTWDSNSLWPQDSDLKKKKEP